MYALQALNMQPMSAMEAEMVNRAANTSAKLARNIQLRWKPLVASVELCWPLDTSLAVLL